MTPFENIENMKYIESFIHNTQINIYLSTLNLIILLIEEILLIKNIFPSFGVIFYTIKIARTHLITTLIVLE